MPIYDYRCTNGHEFEVFQSMSEDSVSSCTECGAEVERVFHPVAVHFKGSGFYTTDYARSSGKDGKDGKSAGSTDGKKDSDSGGDKKSDSSKKDSGGEKAAAGSGGD
jgi:putative FmdB family regulatory protein